MAEQQIQFYEGDLPPLQAAGDFLAGALFTRQTCIAIATPDSHRHIEKQLAARAFDLPTLRATGHYYRLPAPETLSKIMTDGAPRLSSFAEVIGTLVAKAALGNRHVSVFDEMLALLWKNADRSAAATLAEFWQQLGKKHSFSLFRVQPVSPAVPPAAAEPPAPSPVASSLPDPATSDAAAGVLNERLAAITALRHKIRALKSKAETQREIDDILASRRRNLSGFGGPPRAPLYQQPHDDILLQREGQMKSVPATSQPQVNDGFDSQPSLRILLIDDHLDTLQVLRRLLETCGHVVFTANTVASALALSDAHTFDLVISDLDLPDGTGWDVMEHLHRTSPTLPGIAVSGYGTDHERGPDNPVTFTTHLLKPINLDSLQNTILKLARSYPQARHA